MSRSIAFEIAFDNRQKRKVKVVARPSGDVEVMIDNKAYLVKKNQDRCAFLEPSPNGENENGVAPAGTIVAPLPAQVAQVSVKKGARVAAKQVLVTLLAMKMHNDILATHAGRVIEVCVREGQQVKTGDTLMIIEAV